MLPLPPSLTPKRCDSIIAKSWLQCFNKISLLPRQRKMREPLTYSTKNSHFPSLRYSLLLRNKKVTVATGIQLQRKLRYKNMGFIGYQNYS